MRTGKGTLKGTGCPHEGEYGFVVSLQPGVVPAALELREAGPRAGDWRQQLHCQALGAAERGFLESGLSGRGTRILRKFTILGSNYEGVPQKVSKAKLLHSPTPP